MVYATVWADTDGSIGCHSEPVSSRNYDPPQVFQGDVRALRDYLAAESEYADGIRMLDEDGGWALIDVRADS